jgi:hypothetical protein
MPICICRCDCGLRVERLVSMNTPMTACPGCGDEIHKMPTGSRLVGRANRGLSRDHMPQTWRGFFTTAAGNTSPECSGSQVPGASR